VRTGDILCVQWPGNVGCTLDIFSMFEMPATCTVGRRMRGCETNWGSQTKELVSAVWWGSKFVSSLMLPPHELVVQ
jgi:hypothetical protein